MGKAEEAIAKKRTKAARKRLRKSGNVGFKDAIIAAKRRRKAGKRRVCEGMCYTLPTPEDPFNDRSQGRRKKKRLDEDSPVEMKNDTRYDDIMDTQVTSLEDGGLSEEGTSESSGSLQREDSSEDDRDSENVQGGGKYNTGICSRIANSSDGADIVSALMCGAQAGKNQSAFWGACQKGLDVVGTTEGMDVPAMSYVPAAVDSLLKKLSKVTSGRKPAVLVLVSTQKEALSVRRVCKPLKEALGIQALSIHPGTSIEYQVEGLEASCAQIMLATPERLCQLLVKKAISLLNLSLLVVENLDSLITQGFKDDLRTIKSHVSPTTQVIILSETFTEVAVNITREYVEEPVCRFGGTSLKSRAACITQDISVVVDDSKKPSKVLSIMKQRRDASSIVIFAKKDNVKELMDVVRRVEGLEVGCLTTDLKSDISLIVDVCEALSKGSLNVMVAVEEMFQFIDWSNVKTVVNYDCPSGESYRKVLVSMARTSVNGCVYTLCGCSSARVAHELVGVLKESSQAVPSALQMLADAASVVLNIH